MIVNKNEVQSKRRIGTLKGSAVMEVVLKGGLHMVICAKSNGFETLGMAPHPAIARFIAKSKSNDEIEWTELSKSEEVPLDCFKQFLPKYEQLTDLIRARQGLK